MRSQVRMKRRLVACLLVFGLVSAACGTEDSIGSETRDAGTNINFRFLDKNKRGATKITNTDSPTFNHLTNSNTAPTNTAPFKPSAPTSDTPFRYLYNQQYYQPNPYLAYLQIPQAAPIAAQYSFQANPVAHFLQTPTQIQYVATPTVAQVPQIKYQTYSTANPAPAESASSGSNSQYAAQSQQQVASSAAQVSTSSAGQTSPVKQVQVPLYSDYQTAQPVYYTQQPVFTYFPQQQTANYIYQQPNLNFLLKQQQQQQQQIAGIYGANRFGFYSPAQNGQLTYLVPTVLSQPAAQDSSTTKTTSTTSLKSSEKTLANAQQTPSTTNSFSFGTKA